jgi:hypothetical protein
VAADPSSFGGGQRHFPILTVLALQKMIINIHCQKTENSEFFFSFLTENKRPGVHCREEAGPEAARLERIWGCLARFWAEDAGPQNLRDRCCSALSSIFLNREISLRFAHVKINFVWLLHSLNCAKRLCKNLKNWPELDLPFAG